MNTEYTLVQHTIDGADLLIVYGTAGCGTTFEVGVVYEPFSENPLLELVGPLGVNGLAKILEALKGWSVARTATLN